MSYIFVFIILLFSGSILYPQEYDDRTKANLEIINTVLYNDFEKCIEYINLLGSDKIYLIHNDKKNETSEYIIKHFKNTFISYKLITDESIKNPDYILQFENANITTNYKLEEKNLIFKKYIQREIYCGFDFIIKDKDSILYKHKFSDLIRDTIDYKHIAYIETDNYKFTKGKIPEEGFWDKYLIPGSAILISAIAIILFFTIRSK